MSEEVNDAISVDSKVANYNYLLQSCKEEGIEYPGVVITDMDNDTTYILAANQKDSETGEITNAAFYCFEERSYTSPDRLPSEVREEVSALWQKSIDEAVGDHEIAPIAQEVVENFVAGKENLEAPPAAIRVGNNLVRGVLDIPNSEKQIGKELDELTLQDKMDSHKRRVDLSLDTEDPSGAFQPLVSDEEIHSLMEAGAEAYKAIDPVTAQRAEDAAIGNAAKVLKNVQSPSEQQSIAVETEKGQTYTIHQASDRSAIEVTSESELDRYVTRGKLTYNGDEISESLAQELPLAELDKVAITGLSLHFKHKDQALDGKHSLINTPKEVREAVAKQYSEMMEEKGFSVVPEVLERFKEGKRNGAQASEAEVDEHIARKLEEQIMRKIIVRQNRQNPDMQENPITVSELGEQSENDVSSLYGDKELIYKTIVAEDRKSEPNFAEQIEALRKQALQDNSKGRDR
ncbi:MAG: hypothetical protein MK052_01040 [Alphaproteobacteria bacterium]|nr:hypothetical protein [Alphaproteobacteria bacterium]